ncbi:HIT family protein [Nanoarchaeota archaeon]
MSEEGENKEGGNGEGSGAEPSIEEVKAKCIFCQIVSGKVTSKRIYEDDVCVGILDINPANPGHVLLMPKEHYGILPMMPEDEYSKMMVAAKKIGTGILRAVKADGINMFIANGAVAGQKAPHAMIHLIPRKQGDKITAFDLPRNDITPEDQEKLRAIIEQVVKNVM